MKMKPLASILLILLLSNFAQANHIASSDSLIKISGTVLSDLDSSGVKATITYQKLPYYDDMGMASAKEGTGNYEMFMLLNTKYLVQIKAAGFDPWEGEIEILDEDNSGDMTKHFSLQPDKEHQIISLDNLIFASGKSVISKSSYKELDELVTWMNERPGKKIQLEGHTDFAGNAVANMRLSEDRVVAVKDYLVEKGIKKKRVLTKAFGGTQPITRERTSEAKALNRRVEVRILN